ncbi:MAG TPA: hypothetical protein VMH87_09785 [Pseudomonadales bacterium]|nr:hypothetical protein [Pseudomonadales bacterium]
MKSSTIPQNIARVSCAVACFSLVISAQATLPSSDFPDIGSLGALAELGHPLVEISGTTTNTSFTRLTVVYDTVFSDPALTSNQGQVLSASSALAALTPDQTISANQTAALAFDVTPGQVEVVDLNGGLNLNNQSITLGGGGILVLNIEGSFSLDGTAGIFGNPNDIYINYEGNSTITTGIATTIDGLVLDPSASAVLNGNLNRGFYGTLAPNDPPVVPEPGPMALISMALASLLLVRRYQCASKNLT